MPLFGRKKKDRVERGIKEGIRVAMAGIGRRGSSDSSTSEDSHEQSSEESEEYSNNDEDVSAECQEDQSRVVVTEKGGKFKRTATQIMMAKKMSNAMPPQHHVVDGEEIQAMWPATAAWFLGPKAENLDLLKELIRKAINDHADFRQYKYFPLDPDYVTEGLKKTPAFEAATKKLEDELKHLCQRLKNSVPFSSFRSQGHMLWDTTIASNVGYIAALLYNQNNVASMASGVTLQLERECARDLCK